MVLLFAVRRPEGGLVRPESRIGKLEDAEREQNVRRRRSALFDADLVFPQDKFEACPRVRRAGWFKTCAWPSGFGRVRVGDGSPVGIDVDTS